MNDSSDSNHLPTFAVLVFASFRKKEERKRQKQQAKQAHKLLLSIVCESYVFCDSYKCRFLKGPKQQ